MKFINILVVALLVVSFVVSCAPTVSVSANSANEQQLPSDVERIVDTEAGVVCWLTHGTSLAGSGAPRAISCLPLSETLLDK